jgi:hypothetical protein
VGLLSLVIRQDAQPDGLAQGRMVAESGGRRYCRNAMNTDMHRRASRPNWADPADRDVLAAPRHGGVARLRALQKVRR